MKIHFIIEFETGRDGEPKRLRVERVAPITPAPAPLVNIADDVPPPLPAEAAPDAPKVRQAGSGAQFDPGFLALVRAAKEPFTRCSLAVDCGLDKHDVTLRLNRMKHHGWIEQPAPGLWRRTKTFGEKTKSEKTK